MSLEYHKEEFGHWTSDEDDYDEDEEIGKILTKPLQALKLRIHSLDALKRGMNNKIFLPL